MPRNACISPTVVPRTGPPSVATTGDFGAANTVVDAIAARTALAKMLLILLDAMFGLLKKPRAHCGAHCGAILGARLLRAALFATPWARKSRLTAVREPVVRPALKVEEFIPVARVRH